MRKGTAGEIINGAFPLFILLLNLHKLSCPDPECLRRKPIYQYACPSTIRRAENDGHDTEDQRGHFKLDHHIADHIGQPAHELIGTAFDLRSGVVRLEQVVQRQIMHREEHTQRRDGYE